jgi:glycosyltransferase involved in cell wall biosynthesis
VADFRDPWLEVDYLHHLRLTKIARRWHEKLERKVLEGADLIITISEGLRTLLSGKTSRPVAVIPNSFDPDFLKASADEVPYPEIFSIVHTGTMSAERDAPELWKALADFPHPIHVRLVGAVDNQVIRSAGQQGIQALLRIETPVSHQEALKIQKEAALLLVVANRTPTASGILTGKVFEYLASGRPLLAIGPEGGDLHHLINETQAGWFVPYDDEVAARQALEQAYTLWQQGLLYGKPEAAHSYRSSHVIKKLADILHQQGFKDLLRE